MGISIRFIFIIVIYCDTFLQLKMANFSDLQGFALDVSLSA